MDAEPIEPHPCPECGSFATEPTGAPDSEGECEYRCDDCGEYFVDLACANGRRAGGPDRG